MADTAPSRENSLALVRRIVTAIDDKKAADIRVFDVSGKSTITDFVVVATGTSDPHLRAVGNEVDRVLDETGETIAGIESQPGSGWTVVDAYRVMVHLFRPDQRKNFDIERLWKDAQELPGADFLPVAPRVLSDQAVPITGRSKAPAPVIEKIVVKKSVVKKTSAEKSKPEFVKEPKKKRTIKVAAKIDAKVKAKAKNRLPKKGSKPVAETPAAAPARAKPKPGPVKPAVKKLIAKKSAAVAKTARSVENSRAKAGVIHRKPGARH